MDIIFHDDAQKGNKMKVNTSSYDVYAAMMAQGQTNVNMPEQIELDVPEDMDSYIPSIKQDDNTPIPTGNYTASGTMAQDAAFGVTEKDPLEMTPISMVDTENEANAIMDQEITSQSEQTTATTNSDTKASGAAGEAASGGGSSEDTQTTTEVVEINGVLYLQETSVENGVTTVTRTKLSDSQRVLTI